MDNAHFDITHEGSDCLRAALLIAMGSHHRVKGWAEITIDDVPTLVLTWSARHDRSAAWTLLDPDRHPDGVRFGDLQELLRQELGLSDGVLTRNRMVGILRHEAFVGGSDGVWRRADDHQSANPFELDAGDRTR